MWKDQSVDSTFFHEVTVTILVEKQNANIAMFYALLDRSMKFGIKLLDDMSCQLFQIYHQANEAIHFIKYLFLACIGCNTQTVIALAISTLHRQ